MALTDILVRPAFDRPPVVEVAVAVGFNRPHLGLAALASLAGRISGTDYPRLDEAPPVGFIAETPEPVRLQTLIELVQAPKVRFVCRSSDGQRQLQFQDDLVGAEV